MPVLALVIYWSPALHDILQLFRSKHFVRTGRTPDFLGKCQCSAPIAISHANEACPRFLVQWQGTFFLLFGTGQKRCNTRRHEDGKSALSPGTKSGIELERRVFRRGADQDNGAIFHDRQKRILLCTIEAMNFVYEKQCLASRHASRAADSKTFLRSATPEKIAEICSKARSVSPASRRATVVLPVPGGPRRSWSRASRTRSSVSERLQARSDVPDRLLPTNVSGAGGQQAAGCGPHWDQPLLKRSLISFARSIN